ncbi:flagellin lysine-N-methylase [Bacillus toyonensis]|uniref:flagellin lysine-N-methylase n=1 Tax=Bacillus toyonensis TaxID=155322 RepID=UPI002E1D5E03|nr:flagellin lysine-N-methylase [Bacillus toyonensis]
MKQKLFLANYLSEFSCIGSFCEDNCCCSDWAVYVDKEHYELYKNSQEGTLSDLFQSSIEKNIYASSKEDYATIKFDFDGKCSFLTTDKLCQIHKEYGPEALCNVCRYYPRYVTQIDKEYYHTGFLSCPEITRLVLFSKKPLQWKVGINEESSPIVNRIELDINRNYLKRVQDVMDHLIHQRQYSLSKRLWLIGVFIEELYSLTNKGNSKLKSISEAMKKVEKLKKSNPITFLEKQYRLLMQAVLHISYNLDENIAIVNRMRLKECLDSFQEGFSIKSGIEYNLQEILNDYKQKHDKFYHSFFVNYEYMFENYCMYYFQQYLFPYKLESLPSKYIKFILEFAILKFILVGISASPAGLNEKIIIQLFQSFAKAFLHNPENYEKYVTNIYNDLNKIDQQMNTCISILLSEC